MGLFVDNSSSTFTKRNVVQFPLLCYYGLNVYVPLKLICWNLTSKNDGISKSGLWKVLYERGSREIPSSSTMWGHRNCQLKTWKRTLTRNWPCWHLDFELLTSSTVRNKVLLFINYQMYVILYSNPNRLRHISIQL